MKRKLSPLQVAHCHRFTIIGRTLGLKSNINSLINDRSIPNGEYKTLLVKAWEILDKASRLTHDLKLKGEYL
jgi:hypothetical protein